MRKKKQTLSPERTELYNSILNSTIASGNLEGINITKEDAQKMLQRVLIKIEKSL
ncbi:hypothetical protein [Emticicia sp. 21SJ11W-3]|uniref:hypothetical protein n=1 Tax=Emticicia sp. 21SJ11W-3 TaxID=2916755 RepID=UPI0020A1E85D|nr:hypothetical protein [Emticicia sp. 21SJ11W-3]UTA67009.1 hypothetical protein MB380_15545 [Emticicia sp. 21SJ11W-3]